MNGAFLLTKRNWECQKLARISAKNKFGWFNPIKSDRDMKDVDKVKKLGLLVV